MLDAETLKQFWGLNYFVCQDSFYAEETGDIILESKVKKLKRCLAMENFPLDAVDMREDNVDMFLGEVVE